VYQRFDEQSFLTHLLDSGQQLRQDDPSALKDIIDIVQKKVTGKDETSLKCGHLPQPSLNRLLTSFIAAPVRGS
jgi:hypothetical protein